MDLKRYQEWKNRWGDPSQITVMDYISDNIHPEDVLILSALLFPEFLLVQGCVLLPFQYDEATFESLRKRMQASEVEQHINRVKLYDLYAYAPADVSEEIWEKLATMIQMSWKSKLAMQFPHLNLEVELLISDQEYGPILNVFQHI